MHLISFQCLRVSALKEIDSNVEIYKKKKKEERNQWVKKGVKLKNLYWIC